MKASVASTTTGARTVPAVVTSGPGQDLDHLDALDDAHPARAGVGGERLGEPQRVDARRSAASTRRRPASRGPAAHRQLVRRRAGAGRRGRSRTRAPRRPRRAAPTAASRVRARRSVPPCRNCRSTPTAGRRRRRSPPTSATVSNIARCSAIAASRPCRPGQVVEAHREQRRAPAAVAAARPETDRRRARPRTPAAPARRRRGDGPSTGRCSRRRRRRRRRRGGDPRRTRSDLSRPRSPPTGERGRRSRHRGLRYARCYAGPLVNTPRPAPPRACRAGAPTDAFAPPQAAQAGWYPDPYRRRSLRYFDGHRWTHHSATPAPPAAPVEQHPVLPIVTALGATVVLAASLIVSRAVISSIDDRWNIFVLMGVSVLVGYGPSMLWCVFASRRWGTGRPLARLRGALALGRPRLGSDHLAVDDARRRHRRATDQGARRALPQQPRRRRRRGCRPHGDRRLRHRRHRRRPGGRGGDLPRRDAPRAAARACAAPLAIVAQGALFGAAHFQPTFGRDNFGLVIALGLVGVGFGIGATSCGGSARRSSPTPCSTPRP